MMLASVEHNIWEAALLLIGAAFATGVGFIFEFLKNRRDDKAARALTVELLRWFAEDHITRARADLVALEPLFLLPDRRLADTMRDAFTEPADHSAVILNRVEHLKPAELAAFRNLVLKDQFVTTSARQIALRASEWVQAHLPGNEEKARFYPEGSISHNLGFIKKHLEAALDAAEALKKILH